MATQTARYYSEGGRATKRQKTDNDGGMATVSKRRVGEPLPALSVLLILFLFESTRTLCDLAREWRALAA